MDDLLELDERVLTFDISDEALERAATPEQQAVTWAYCTSGAYWYDCNWPQKRSVGQHWKSAGCDSRGASFFI